jgi:hypothetical protein
MITSVVASITKLPVVKSPYITADMPARFPLFLFIRLTTGRFCCRRRGIASAGPQLK